MSAVLQKPVADTGRESVPGVASDRARSSASALRRRRRNFALRTSPFALPRSGDTDGASDVENPYTFTARRWDAESGLMQYRYRYYEPGLGRFLIHDPMLYADTYCLYLYGLSNPIRFADPSGLGLAALLITGEWSPDQYTLDQASAGWLEGLGHIPGTDASLGQYLYTGNWDSSDEELQAGLEGGQEAVSDIRERADEVVDKVSWAVLPDEVKSAIQAYVECCEKGKGHSTFLYFNCQGGLAYGGGEMTELGLEAHVICDSGQLSLYGYGGIGGAQGWGMNVSCTVGGGFGWGIDSAGDYTGAFAGFGVSGGAYGVGGGIGYSTDGEGIHTGNLGAGLSLGTPGGFVHEQAQGYVMLNEMTVPD